MLNQIAANEACRTGDRNSHRAFLFFIDLYLRHLFKGLIMPLSTTLAEYIRANFKRIRIESHGHQDALVEVGRSFTTDANELPTGAESERTIAAAVGLSRYEAEGAFTSAILGRTESVAGILAAKSCVNFTYKAHP
jgi:hypothetical protein